MAKAKVSDNKKRRPGRPATGIGQLIGVRMNDDELAALDSWRSEQEDEPNRPSAIRHLVGKALSTTRKSAR